MDLQPSAELEAGIAHSDDKKRGGWITFPFIAGALFGLMLASWGWQSNVVVYLIQEFNVKTIAATQISNIVHGSTNMLPLAAAVLSDSFFGSYSVIMYSSIFLTVGLIMLTLTASVTSLRPPRCAIGSSTCQAASKSQLAVLYVAMALASIGLGGTRFLLAPMGAYQYDEPQHQDAFFNWYCFFMYVALVVSSIGLVYVESSVSWTLGFGLCTAVGFVGSVMFLLGSRFYRFNKSHGSPYTSLARVLVASIRKMNLPSSSNNEDYYHEKDNLLDNIMSAPSRSLRFLNRAAIKANGDIHSDGSIAKPWRLCTVQEVENLKTLAKIFPLWSSTIFLFTPATIQLNMTVVQALVMNRHIGPAFKIPAATVIVVSFIVNCIIIAAMDRYLLPTWKRLTHRTLTSLQRIGVGHVFSVLSMIVSALVEAKRLKIAHVENLIDQSGAIVPLSVLWLFPQLVIIGIAEAFYFPGQVALYYQEFPVSLKSTSTAVISLVGGIAFYVNTALVDLIQHITGWLPDNINAGRLDNFYWTLGIMGLVNFGYYLVCANWYKYRNVEQKIVPSGVD